jgi:hypothetical protein
MNPYLAVLLAGVAIGTFGHTTITRVSKTTVHVSRKVALKTVHIVTLGKKGD